MSCHPAACPTLRSIFRLPTVNCGVLPGNGKPRFQATSQALVDTDKKTPRMSGVFFIALRSTDQLQTGLLHQIQQRLRVHAEDEGEDGDS